MFFFWRKKKKTVFSSLQVDLGKSFEDMIKEVLPVDSYTSDEIIDMYASEVSSIYSAICPHISDY